MVSLQHIDLLALQSSLKLSRAMDGSPMLFDPVRRKYVRTNPEELVRQLWIVYFVEVLHLNSKLIAVERSFLIEGMERRFDLILFDKSGAPWLLAEFKAPEIALNQSVFDQVAQYNMELKVPYALVSNGREHYCFQIDNEKKGFFFLPGLPSLPLNPLKGT